MAAPAVQTRSTPTGAIQYEGGPTSRFTIGLNKALCIREFEIAACKIVGGQPIRISSFFNVLFHTKVPQTLLDLEAFVVRGFYDMDIWKDTMYKTVMNKNGAMTFRSAEGSTLSVFGWAREVTFQPHKLGEAPTLELMCEVSNWDPVNRVEAGPSYSDGYTGTADG